MEAAFRKLDNAQRKKKLNKYGTPDSRWLRCPKLDPVVSANVSREATKADRSSSRLHQFLLDPVSPLVSTLELAEGGDLTPEAAIANTQAALVLLGNASQHFATERRKVLLQQLNPKLKALVEDSDFSDAPPLLFGTNFGKVAKDRLDAAEALKKASTSSGWSGKQFFRKSHPRKGTSSQWSRGSGSRYGSQNSQQGRYNNAGASTKGECPAATKGQ